MIASSPEAGQAFAQRGRQEVSELKQSLGWKRAGSRSPMPRDLWSGTAHFGAF